MPILVLDATLDEPREIIGGKAWSVARMLRLGVPVPPAFVITTDECARYHETGAIPASELPLAMARLEADTGRQFGAGLLVSVRSGAPTSMPGMMDTVLNLGMTEDGPFGDAAFAADTRRRFHEQYAAVVGVPAPADPWEQLHGAIRAVFDSWRSDRAIAYRRQRGLPEQGGTAVTVQAMVFGNRDDRSGTGVLFTRDPRSGADQPLGEWLPLAQGEDVVSGRNDPLPLEALLGSEPALHAELLAHAATLERDARDVQDIEFTIESGRLWLLQTRNAKRSAAAAVRFAVSLERDGLIDRATALDRVMPADVEAVGSDGVDARGATVLAKGRPAAPGIAAGVIVTDPEEAEDRALDGEAIVLARPTTNPDDVRAMAAVAAIVTEIGGSTSHAAVVSRELGTPCVVGCGPGVIERLTGRRVTVDATAGVIYDGELTTTRETAVDPDVAALTRWAQAEAGQDRPLQELLARRRA